MRWYVRKNYLTWVKRRKSRSGVLENNENKYANILPLSDKWNYHKATYKIVAIEPLYLYIGSQAIISKTVIFLSLKIVVVLAIRADPYEMPPCVQVNQDVNWLS